jgi:small-conductance mechanosensitive channel
MQAALVASCYLVAYLCYYYVVKKPVIKHGPIDSDEHPIANILLRLLASVYPVLAIVLLKLSFIGIERSQYPAWLVSLSLTLAILLLFYSLIREFVANPLMASLFKWVGLPILLLHMVGFLPELIDELKAISIHLGNIEFTLFGLLRVLIFGAVLFWLGRVSSRFGKDVIRKQEHLDIATREVFSKLFEVGLFCFVFILLLNIMGINLTALAVFGGALGVGLGLGLQSIASNFISGIIILLDKSLTIGDFVELDGGQKGFVREFKMRHAVLETYDGKDVLVPNETFISSLLTNWTHKDPKQRYRVDFSVAYDTDVRTMVEIIKEAVASHPQVISGEGIPFEEQPDCEIDSFGDNGVNMFVEFWIEGIDDGKNRVGGDLLLIILETLKAHDISIPFPQREVKILNQSAATVL